jgi:hypothetical protein
VEIVVPVVVIDIPIWLAICRRGLPHQGARRFPRTMARRISPGETDPLPTFIKFADLKAAGIVANHGALRILIERHGFPKGRWFGSATHVWTVAEVEEWLAERPAARPVPDAMSTPKHRRRQ